MGHSARTAPQAFWPLWKQFQEQLKRQAAARQVQEHSTQENNDVLKTDGSNSAIEGSDSDDLLAVLDNEQRKEPQRLRQQNHRVKLKLSNDKGARRRFDNKRASRHFDNKSASSCFDKSASSCLRTNLVLGNEWKAWSVFEEPCGLKD
ncbi:unnamed protein product [Phytophthora lilii]|uniref:Unnamed protein product n=1 Tax=Phytophthora lilii TaxID=2077276 RepID=A0A9W6WND7_9STRA|nr:unnamed protein product [Phytophthora lilii]